MRDPWPDNARFVAATLIVIGHFTSPLTSQFPELNTLHGALWPMRVPLYVLIAGYFSTADPFTYRKTIELVRNVLLVYVTFEMLTTAQAWLISGKLNFNPSVPSYALWFMLSLFIWRATLPLISKIRWVIPISFVVAATAGFAPSIGANLSLGRTLAYAPLFLVGWKLGRIGLHNALDRRWVRNVALVIVAGWIIGSIVFAERFNRSMFAMRDPYDTDHLLRDFVARMFLIVAGTIVALSMMALTPRRKLPLISYLGTGSLYIYLLHPIILRQFKAWDFYDHVNTGTGVIAVIAFSIAVAFFLGSKPVRWLTHSIVQPRYTWLFVPDTAPKPAVAGSAANTTGGRSSEDGSSAIVTADTVPARDTVTTADDDTIAVGDATATVGEGTAANPHGQVEPAAEISAPTPSGRTN